MRWIQPHVVTSNVTTLPPSGHPVGLVAEQGGEALDRVDRPDRHHEDGREHDPSDPARYRIVRASRIHDIVSRRHSDLLNCQAGAWRDPWPARNTSQTGRRRSRMVVRRRRTRRPVVLDAHDRPALGVSPARSPARRRRCSRTPVGVVVRARAAGTRSGRTAGEPSIGTSPFGVPGGDERPPPDAAPDPHRLRRTVIEHVRLGLVHDRATSVVILVGSSLELPITRSGGIP